MPGSPPRPDSPYGVCKLFAEACGRYFSDRFGMSVPVIRLGAVLAEDRPRLVRHFPGFLSQADAVSRLAPRRLVNGRRIAGW